ncbi:hypothetical protein LD10_16570, partial [Neisseria meningitidis]
AFRRGNHTLDHFFLQHKVQSSGLVRLDLHGNAFLHHMVRNIMGALVYVGSGRLSVEGFAALIQERSRL